MSIALMLAAVLAAEEPAQGFAWEVVAVNESTKEAKTYRVSGSDTQSIALGHELVCRFSPMPAAKRERQGFVVQALSYVCLHGKKGERFAVVSASSKDCMRYYRPSEHRPDQAQLAELIAGWFKGDFAITTSAGSGTGDAVSYSLSGRCLKPEQA